MPLVACNEMLLIVGCFHVVFYILGKFPTSDGLLAPGMSCHYSIQFTPDSLADYDDVLKVSTSSNGIRKPKEGCHVLIFQSAKVLVTQSLPRENVISYSAENTDKCTQNICYSFLANC